MRTYVENILCTYVFFSGWFGCSVDFKIHAEGKTRETVLKHKKNKLLQFIFLSNFSHSVLFF